MARETLISEGQLQSWQRRGKVAVAGYMGLILLVGLVYIVAKLIGAEFGPLFIGLVATIAGCAVGAVAWGVLWLMRKVVLQAHQLERLRERLALLEATLELREAEAEAATVTAGAAAIDKTSPVEATADLDASAADDLAHQHFPRIADFQGPALQWRPQVPKVAAAPPMVSEIEEAPPAAIDERQTVEAEAGPQNVREQLEAAIGDNDLPAAQRLWTQWEQDAPAEVSAELGERLDALTQETSTRLRDEFARLVREENFEAAMMKGEEIAELLPGSRMQAEYHALRPQLERRAHQRRTAQI